MKNNNETHSQYQEDFEKIKRIIGCIKDDKNISDYDKEKRIFGEFYSFLSEVLTQDTELAPIIDITSEIIDDNREFVEEIISAFTQNLIDHNKASSDIRTSISEIVNTDRIKKIQI